MLMVLLQQVGSNKPLMLGIEPVPHAMLSWKDVAPEQVGRSSHQTSSSQ